MGLDVNSDFIGWNGNSTLSVETVLESIVTLKKNFALPEISIEFKKDKEMIIKRAEVKFDNVWYPLGRGIFVLWIWGLMNQFLKDHQLNKAEFGVTDGSISV